MRKSHFEAGNVEKDKFLFHFLSFFADFFVIIFLILMYLCVDFFKFQHQWKEGKSRNVHTNNLQEERRKNPRDLSYAFQHLKWWREKKKRKLWACFIFRFLWSLSLDFSFFSRFIVMDKKCKNTCKFFEKYIKNMPKNCIKGHCHVIRVWKRINVWVFFFWKMREIIFSRNCFDFFYCILLNFFL